MQHHTFKLNKVMIPEPRLMAAFKRGSKKWTTINKHTTMTILKRSSSRIEIHIVQEGNFIVRQTFTPLSSSPPTPFRRITHGTSGVAVTYDSIQTPVISGDKMRETFQLGFSNSEELPSFLNLMQGYFTLVAATTPPKMRTPLDKQSQPGPSSSPTKSSAIISSPFTSPTESVNEPSRNNSKTPTSFSQPKNTPSPAKRSKSNKKSKLSQDIPSGQLSPPQPISQSHTHQPTHIKLGEEATPTPSPPQDDATERLKKALLGNFQTFPSDRAHKKEGESHKSSISDGHIEAGEHSQANQSELSSTVESSDSSATSSSDVPKVDLNSHQELPPPAFPFSSSNELTQSCLLSSHNPDGNHHLSVQGNKLDVNIESQPLIVFSPCLEPVSIPLYTNMESNLSASSSEENFDRHVLTSNLEDLFNTSHPVMLTDREYEVEKVRRGKRKRDELDDELEEEDSQGIEDETQAENFPIDCKPLQPLSLLYGRGVYDLSSEDLEKLVEEVAMEKGFERLVGQIQTMVDRRCETIQRESAAFSNQNLNLTDQRYRAHQPNHHPVYWQQPESHTDYRTYPKQHTYLQNVYNDYYSYDHQPQHTYPAYNNTTEIAYTQPQLTQYHQDKSYSYNDYSHQPQAQLTYSQHDQATQHSEYYPEYNYDNEREYDYDNERFEVYNSSSKRSSRSSAFETASEKINLVIDNTPYPPTDAQSYQNLYERANNDEEDEITNISREFDTGFSPLQMAEEDEEEEKEYDYDNELAEEDLELEKEIED